MTEKGDNHKMTLIFLLVPLGPMGTLTFSTPAHSMGPQALSGSFHSSALSRLPQSLCTGCSLC